MRFETKKFYTETVLASPSVTKLKSEVKRSQKNPSQVFPDPQKHSPKRKELLHRLRITIA
jgi:hypothetical protein